MFSVVAVETKLKCQNTVILNFLNPYLPGGAKLSNSPKEDGEYQLSAFKLFHSVGCLKAEHFFYWIPSQKIIRYLPQEKGSSNFELASLCTGGFKKLKTLLINFPKTLQHELKEYKKLTFDYKPKPDFESLFKILRIRIKIDFKYLPQISLENAATMNIELRNILREANRDHIT